MKYHVTVTVVGVDGSRVLRNSAVTMTHASITAKSAGDAIGIAALNTLEDAEKMAKTSAGLWVGPYIVEAVECKLLTEEVLS